MNKQDLIAACCKKDPSAQKELYDRYSSKLYAVSYRYAGNKMDAEDILQEGFIKIFNNIASLKSEAALESWMRRIVVNTALKFLSKNKNNGQTYDLENVQKASDDVGVISQMSAKEILRVVATLPSGYRTVFNLYVLEGFKHKDISDMLGIEESTSRTQLLKARKLLMKKLKKNDRPIDRHAVNYGII